MRRRGAVVAAALCDVVEAEEIARAEAEMAAEEAAAAEEAVRLQAEAQAMAQAEAAAAAEAEAAAKAQAEAEEAAKAEAEAQAAMETLGGGGALCGVSGPAWTRGEMEAPQGEKDMGTYTVAAFTVEQQARLGVDEAGQPVESAAESGTADAATPSAAPAKRAEDEDEIIE